MKKISVGQFSTITGESFKAKQVCTLSEMLAERGKLFKIYGLYSKEEVKINRELYVTTKLPVLFMRLFEKVRGLKLIPSYYSRIFGESIYDFIVSLKLKNDLSDIFYTSPRSNHSIKTAKALGKKVILEVGEMHPCYTYEAVKSEYKKYNIKHKFIYTDKYAVYKFKKSIDLADYIITLSQYAKKSLIDKGVINKPIYVINLGCRYPEFDISTNQDKQFAFISTAFHSFVKGTHNLLIAWRNARIDNAELILIGEIHDDVKEFIKKYGPFDNVKYVGYKNINEFYPHFNAVGILPSLAEAYPRTVVEYMQQGFPVIVTPVASCDIVENGKHGIMVQPNDIDGLTDALIYFNNHRPEALLMGQYAKEAIIKIKDTDYPYKVLKVIDEISAYI